MANKLDAMEEDEDFEKIEMCEKNNTGELRMNGKKIKGITGYNLKRGTDMIELTITISVPISNFRTVEN